MKEERAIRQKRAINALLKHSTIKDAAKASNIPLRTLEHWLAQPDFQEALNLVLIEVDRSIIRQITALQVDALDATRDVLFNPNQPGASNKLKAAIKILDYGRRHSELTIIEDRMQKMEEEIAKAIPKKTR